MDITGPPVALKDKPDSVRSRKLPQAHLRDSVVEFPVKKKIRS